MGDNKIPCCSGSYVVTPIACTCRACQGPWKVVAYHSGNFYAINGRAQLGPYLNSQDAHSVVNTMNRGVH